jgi:hypothetical protein
VKTIWLGLLADTSETMTSGSAIDSLGTKPCVAMVFPWLHMREMGKLDGHYAKWQPRDQHGAEIAAFFKDVTSIIHDCGLIGVYSIVRQADIEQINSESMLQLEPYALAAHSCMFLTNWFHPMQVVEMVFDHRDRVTSQLGFASDYARTDPKLGKELYDHIIPTGLNPKSTFRDVTEIQCADYLAWECRKDHHKIKDWWTLKGRPDDLDGRQKHFEEWAQQTGIAPPRKSMDALRQEKRVVGIVWDYESLREENLARKGLWK